MEYEKSVWLGYNNYWDNKVCIFIMFFNHICLLFCAWGCLFHLLKASDLSTGPLNSDALVKTNGQLGKHNINSNRGKV